jgi:ATP-dependent helicase/nuclease subunit A
MEKRASILETFDLTSVQRSALEVRGRDVVLIAGAGSGKTRTLTARYLSLLEQNLAPRSVVAVTFTEKAAREMRNRIRARVNEWVRDARSGQDRARWAAIEADIDTARIGTIHSLCAEILRTHPVEAAVDPGFEVLEEGLAAAWKSQAVEDALAWASGEADLVPVLRAFTPMPLRAGLTKLIGFRLEAAEAFEGVDLVARWDSALNARVREFVEGSEVLDAIRKLEELEKEGRLEADAGPKLNQQVQQLLAEWHAMTEALARSSPMEAVGRLAGIREECLNLTVGRKAGQAKPRVRLIRDRYEAQVERWLGRVKDTQALEQAEESLRALVPGLRALFAKAAEFYARARDQKHALDFDDLEDGAARLLDRDEVRRLWRDEIRAVLVDEFQDTNARQRRIVEALSGSRDEEHGGLFVVGDAKQSIYRFRGADVTVFVEVERAAAKAGGEVLHLAETFRAHAGLVDVLNGVLAPAMNSALPRRPYQVPYERLEARRAEPRDETRPPFVEMLVAEGGNAEASRQVAAAALANRLGELAQAGVPWDDMALLFRASTSFPDFERALEDAGIPFVTVAGRGFYDRPEIRDLLNLLRAVANPWDDLAMAGLLRSPAFGLSDAALYRLRRPVAEGEPVSFRHALSGDLSALGGTDQPRAERAREALKRLEPMADRISVAELLKDLLDSTRLGAALRAAPSGERLQRNIDKLLQDAHASGIARVEDFLEYIETLKSAGAREGEAPSEAQGAVRLMTVHKAKGLEFPVVVLADASRQAPTDYARIMLSREMGVVARPGRRTDEEPVSYRLAKAIDREEEQAEEQRLLYVGATRAQERLIVIGYRGGQHGSSWFSQLMEALPEESSSVAGAATGPVLRLPDTGGLIALRTVRDFPAPARHPASPPPVPPEDATLTPLYRVVPEHDFEISDDKLLLLETTRKRRQGLFATRTREGATLVGNLVHLAIRRGIFPGDARLRPLLEAGVRQAGVLDAAEARAHIAEVEQMLERLQVDSRWAEFEGGRRYHEVPFSVSEGEGVSSGYIDMLAEAGPRAWRVVDFKTTRIKTEAELERLLQTEFRPQLARYRRAVERQVGGKVETWVCLLDYDNHIEWRRGP